MRPEQLVAFHRRLRVLVTARVCGVAGCATERDFATRPICRASRRVNRVGADVERNNRVAFHVEDHAQIAFHHRRIDRPSGA